MENDLFENFDPNLWWIDRIGNMEFIDDQCISTYAHEFYWHMVRIADTTGFNFDGLI